MNSRRPYARPALALLALVASLLSGVAACHDTTAAAAGQLRLFPTSATVRNVGDSLRVSAVLIGSDGGGSTPVAAEWSSADPSIATVTPDGLLIARGVGSVDLTATYEGIATRLPVLVPRRLSFTLGEPVLLGAGDSTTLRAYARYADSPADWQLAAHFSSRDTSLVATEDRAGMGLIRARARAGRTYVIATAADGASDSVLVVLWNPSFYAWPDTNLLPLGVTRMLQAKRYTVSPASLAVLSGATWRSSNPSVATVDAGGVVTPVQPGHATIVAELQGVTASAEVYVPARDHTAPFTTIAAGDYLGASCALSEGRPYCWWESRQEPEVLYPAMDRCEALSYPQYRTGEVYRIARRCAPSPLLVPVAKPLAVLREGPIALATDGTLYALTAAGFTESAPGYRFRTISLSNSHRCAVGLDGTGYCWERNNEGALGVGTAQALGPYPAGPQVVKTIQAWTAIEAGPARSCGIAQSGETYCWGSNTDFALGIGPDSSKVTGCYGPCVVLPRRVQLASVLTSLAMGADDSCGLTAAGSDTFCWGRAPATLPRAQAGMPVRVAGAPTFQSLTGGGRVCGVSVDGGAYCLVRNEAATDTARVYSFARLPLPFAVRSLSVGGPASCAIATDGRAYCWGAGGSLGDGRFTSAPVTAPALVAGQ